MVGGGGVRLASESAVTEAELLVAVEVDGGPAGAWTAGPPGEAGAGAAAEPLVRTASAIEPGWLPAERVTTAVEVGFDPGRERVVAHRRTRYRDLVIDEREVSAPEGEPTEAALAAAAAAHLDRALGLGEEPVAGLLARLRSLAGWRRELGLPAFDEPELRRLLPALCRGRRSFDELRRAPLAELIRGALGYERLAALDREAPERLEVPSGSRLRLAYEPGRPPVLAVRIQELFGLAETPRVAGGRVPVLLHLLAPNGRPQQVTDDLAGFWQRT
jgi:ATP-dependent helicase HrpB